MAGNSSSFDELAQASELSVFRFVADGSSPPGIKAPLHLNSLQPDNNISKISFKYIYYVEIDPREFAKLEGKRECWESLLWLFKEKTSHQNGVDGNGSEHYIEIGPRLNFKTSFCTNALSITESLDLGAVKRIERSKLFQFTFTEAIDGFVWTSVKKEFRERFMDPVLECEYSQGIQSFHVDIPKMASYEIQLLQEGKSALIKANNELSLGFDEDDLEFYCDVFLNKLHRNPTNVECLDLAQSNSEHSRHWFFNGQFTIDGKPAETTLFRMVKDTQKYTNTNNVIKFSDNSSAIQGFEVDKFLSSNPLEPATFKRTKGVRHIIFTAETHNFPTAVEPFSGATTGTGGRIRDVQGTGRGAHVIAGTAGYSFGNCHIQGYGQPWEDQNAAYPPNFAHPLRVIIEASNGASDYGNKFGEPVVCGFARSFGCQLPNGERREWVKPIMFSGGIGSIDEAWVKKQEPDVGMKVAKIGGPVYRIGLGGGAASSTVVQGSNDSAVDFNAVQRGDAEMEQKLNRVIRGCIELDDNPILSIHDQGAGGNANVLKEIVHPSGAVIHADRFTLGDETLSIHELWVAENQESNAVLIPDNRVDVVKQLSARERCKVDVVGEINGSGKIELEDFSSNPSDNHIKPVSLDLGIFLGDIPPKKYDLHRSDQWLAPDAASRVLNISVRDAVERVLQLPSVASKRYLTNKVDRSVTGLVAQQQCVGPLHTPLADVAVVALSEYDVVGGATAIGEQPIKMLFDVKRGARLSVVEALTNLVFAKISDIRDVKCSGNWMWPAKLPGEGAALYDACEAMCEIMRELGIAIDGGKDSLSMAAKVGDEVVKAPGTLVISVYAPCPDIRKKITPDLKAPGGRGSLLWVDLSHGKRRLQGSALSQAFSLFDRPWEVPDLESVEEFVKAFNVTQRLIEEGLVVSGHDISDGGLITCLLEMAIAGNVVFDVDLQAHENQVPLEVLFSEEVGWVLECDPKVADRVTELFKEAGVSANHIGHSYKILAEEKNLAGREVQAPFVHVNGDLVYGVDQNGIAGVRAIWEEFSHQIERIQMDVDCADSQKAVLSLKNQPEYQITFAPDFDFRNISVFLKDSVRPKVAIIREEGSNGDREMAVAFDMVGFEAWDINVQDLLDEKITLDRFQGAVFVGGFSYADVFGSAKGWAAVLANHSYTRNMLEKFYRRRDTFSLGVCNGCQLMALLGIVGSTKPAFTSLDITNNPVTLQHNKSGRFESRFSTVHILASKAVMLKGMAGTQLGIWVAHGEGRFDLDGQIQALRKADCVALQYVDYEGRPTETYPLNPNGSTEGVAGLCSADGRHLAVMPHPERSILSWQWPWRPEMKWPADAVFTPWIKMFGNAYDWCIANQ